MACRVQWVCLAQLEHLEYLERMEIRLVAPNHRPESVQTLVKLQEDCFIFKADA